MNTLELIDALHAGRPVFGTLIVSPSPRWTEAVRGSGLDFVFLDTEHIALDRAQLSWMCRAYSALGLPPIVRIPSPDPFAASMVLDGGAAGVIAPYIESAEQVRALRGAVKLRPLKGERLTQKLAGGELEPALEAYLTERNQSVMIANIESTPAMAALDEILAVPGLDAVLIGPHDLSCSLGVPEEYSNPKFLAACETIFRKARAARIGAGIHFSGNAEELAGFAKLGANLLIHSSDITLFKTQLQRDLEAVRQAAGFSRTTHSPASAIHI